MRARRPRRTGVRRALGAVALVALLGGVAPAPATAATMAVATATATPADGYAIAPVPAWVAPIAAGTADPDAGVRGGQRHLLVDRQYRDDGARSALHHHYVTEVASQAGLSDASKLSIAFDPAYQRLEIHSASVLRDGRRSDRLARARIDVARTENDHDRDLLHGELSALVVLPDVRVGDTVETRYTVHGRNPVFGVPHHSTWRVRWGVPVARSALRITVPASMPIEHTGTMGAELVESETLGLRTLDWRWEHLERVERPDHAPRWTPDPDRLEVTAYRSWGEVADWGERLFAGHPAEGERYARLARTLRETAEERGLERAIADAIDHVQRRVRYYGLELGENSHRPHSPDEVLANGYGDCKDKALLLVSLLGELGVEAHPILVSMRTRCGIVERLPSPGAFDHVVVLVDHAGERHWVDATDNGQRGLLGRRGQPEYGAGLALGLPGEALVTREAPVPEIPALAMHDRYHLSSTGGPVDLVATKTFRGVEANRFRRDLDREGRRGVERRLRELQDEIHGATRSLEPLEIVEDDEANEIVATASYRLDDFWDVDRYRRSAEVEALALGVLWKLDELPETRRGRTVPFALEGPTRVAHRIEFHPSVASPERELE